MLFRAYFTFLAVSVLSFGNYANLPSISDHPLIIAYLLNSVCHRPPIAADHSGKEQPWWYQRMFVTSGTSLFSSF